MNIAWNSPWRRIAPLVAVAAMAVGCSDRASHSASSKAESDALTGNVRIDGSSTVFPISEAIAEAFGDEHGDVRVSVTQSGTSAGMGKFLRNENEICDASRGIKDAEKQQATEAGIEYIEFTVAYDGLAVVVNPQNTWCDSVTVEELKRIWRPEADGEILTWNQINPDWPEEPLKLFGPGTASGTFDYFTEVICGEAKASRPDYTASEDDNMLVRGVVGEKGALGYFGFAYYSQNSAKLKLVAVDGGKGPVKPSEETVLDGTYTPLSRPLFIYVNKAALKRPEMQAFVKFYLDNAAQFSKEVGYVPVPKDVAAKNLDLFNEAVAK